VGRISLLLCRSAALALLLITGAAGAFAATVELISKADPVPDSFGSGFVSGMSADGRYVLFQSVAPNLISGQVDTNGFWDLFLLDRVASTTTLISHAAGKPNTAGQSPEPFDPIYFSADADVSADGRYVAFVSFWTDLVPNPGGTNGSGDVYLWDRVTRSTTLISHAAGDPAVTADGFALFVRISADGNDVVFTSSGSNLVAGQSPSAAGPEFNTFLYHRPSGTLTLISHRSGAPVMEGTGDAGDAGEPAISADGSSVAFLSSAADLVPGQSTLTTSVYLYQRATGAVSLVSHAAGVPLGPPNGSSSGLRISADGRWIAFLSQATNLIAGELPSSSSYASNAFLYDRVAGALRLASHTTASLLTPGTAGDLALSADGRYLAFDSPAPDLVPGQVNLGSSGNVFVYDRIANAISLVSRNRDSATTTPSGGLSGGPSVSADGRYIAYQSTAVDLIPHQTDTADGFDIFVYDQSARTTVLASHVRTSLTTAANGGSQSPRISADGGVVAFGSYATNLAGDQVDPNGFQDVFLFDRKSAEVTALSQASPDLPAVAPFGPSSSAGISSDGRWVVFVSQAAGLVASQVDTPYAVVPYGDPKGTWDVFLRDRATGKTTLLSRSTVSPPTATGGIDPGLSADGNFAAFTVPYQSPDSQSLGRLEVYDRAADALTLANHLVGSAVQPDGLPYGWPALSTDGRYIAYTCSVCHLVPGQQDGRPSYGQALDVFLYDRVTGANTLVSHASGLPATTGDSDSQEPRISADGRFVVFLSAATDLTAGQAGPADSANVFVFDRTTGAVTLVNHTAGSPAAASGPAYDAVISADGRWIAYRSAAVDLVPGQVDTNGVNDVFLYDQGTGITALVSHASSSPVTAGASDQDDYEVPVLLSADGHWVVFGSSATDLVAGEVNPQAVVAVYLYDRTTGAVSLVSSAAGSSTAARYAWGPAISGDGSRITFLSPATDLVPGQDRSQLPSLFVQDRATGARTFVARVTAKPYYPDGISPYVSFVTPLSADGRVVAFTSDSPLVAGDFNQTWDAFVYDAAAQGGPVAVPPCVLFNGVLHANVRKPLTAAGACGVPATAKQVAIRLTVSQGTGQGNVQLFAGTATTPAAGILRFSRGATRSAAFNVALGNGVFSLLPFVAGNGTVRTSVEVDGYTP
jgi:Tol biopolymer transport system component